MYPSSRTGHNPRSKGPRRTNTQRHVVVACAVVDCLSDAVARKRGGTRFSNADGWWHKEEGAQRTADSVNVHAQGLDGPQGYPTPLTTHMSHSVSASSRPRRTVQATGAPLAATAGASKCSSSSSRSASSLIEAAAAPSVRAARDLVCNQGSIECEPCLL